METYTDDFQPKTSDEILELLPDAGSEMAKAVYDEVHVSLTMAGNAALGVPPLTDGVVARLKSLNNVTLKWSVKHKRIEHFKMTYNRTQSAKKVVTVPAEFRWYPPKE